MYCTECGLEIQGKGHKIKGEMFCDDCKTRHSRKPDIPQSTQGSSNDNSYSTRSQSTVTSYTESADRPVPAPSQYASDNPFANEETYANHVNQIRKKLLLPRLYIMLPTLFIIFMIAGREMPILVYALLIVIYGISFLFIYLKYFSYKPSLSQLVVVEGTMKRRLFRSKNDDRVYRLTELKGIRNLEALKQSKKSEVYLRGIRNQVAPYLDQRVTYYIDSKLEMILVCKQ